jgi:hypothetical protein
MTTAIKRREVAYPSLFTEEYHQGISAAVACEMTLGVDQELAGGHTPFRKGRTPS